MDAGRCDRVYDLVCRGLMRPTKPVVSDGARNAVGGDGREFEWIGVSNVSIGTGLRGWSVGMITSHITDDETDIIHSPGIVSFKSRHHIHFCSSPTMT